MAEGLKPILSSWTLITLVNSGIFSPSMAEKTPGGCFLGKEGKKLARETMKKAMSRFFGTSDHDHFGWPDSFLDSLQHYADNTAKCLIRGESIPGWMFLN